MTDDPVARPSPRRPPTDEGSEVTDFETLRSNKAIVAHRQINCDTGGATVQCVVLADGFIVECGSDGYAQERAAHLADAINAFGAERFAFTRRQP